MDCTVDNSIVSMLSFLNVLLVLWLCRRIPLFLKGGKKDEESPEGDSCLRATISQVPSLSSTLSSYPRKSQEGTLGNGDGKSSCQRLGIGGLVGHFFS